MDEKDFASAIENIGGQAYVVGGWVRDLIMDRASNDKDFVIVGVSEDAFAARFPSAKRVGNSFPVYMMRIGGEKREVAFARTERKTGSGYKGFTVISDPSVTIEDDLFRRDLTVNSIALSLADGAICDPYGGVDDIRCKILRATSERFSDDPVRALRAARLSAQLEFPIEPGTILLMRGCREELKLEPRERIFIELQKALATKRPSVFFRAMNEAGLLRNTLPWLFDLIGKSQPLTCHPEGDAFEHTMIVLDKVSRQTQRLELRFAALMHDIGKGATAEELLPHHYGHEKTGLDILAEMNRVLRIPRLWKQCAAIVIKQHMRAPCLTRPAKIRDLLVAIAKHPIGFDGFNIVVGSDHDFLPEYLREYEKYMTAIKKVRLIPIPEKLSGAEINFWRRQLEIRAVAEVLAGTSPK